jgi:C4-dicarboxylate-binding protein DctP
MQLTTKQVLAVVFVFLISLIIPQLCLAKNNKEDKFADLPDIELTFAHNATSDPKMHNQAAALAFKEYAETTSMGKIKVNISPGGALGDTYSLQDQTIMGSIEISCSHTEGTMAMVFPKIQVISIPYLFKSVDHALWVMDHEYGKKMFAEFKEKTGVRVIGVWDNGGFRNFTNNKRPVHTAEDMKGLNIRTMEIPAHMAIVKALGASPTPIGWSELYTSLQTGVVDGQENALPVIIAGNLYEVQKYLTLDGHVYSQIHLFANEKWFSKLPQAYQTIILDAGYRAQTAGRLSTRVLRDRGVAFLKSKMEEVYSPTPEEIETFRTATQEPVMEMLYEKVGKETIEEFMEAVKKSAADMGYEQ